MIVEAGWDLMVQWTKAHAAKASKAKMIAEQKQIALGDVANMLAERCDGAFFTERCARDAREAKEKRHAAIKYESLSS